MYEIYLNGYYDGYEGLKPEYPDILDYMEGYQDGEEAYQEGIPID